MLRDFYLYVFFCQVLFYCLAAAGRLVSSRATILPYTFVLMNWAALTGLFEFVRGSTGIWNPDGLKRGVA
jgi:hypothetical protein